MFFLKLLKNAKLLYFDIQVNNDIVDKNTVQFCARKVAAVAGDMRKALDIMRYVYFSKTFNQKSFLVLYSFLESRPLFENLLTLKY